MPRQQSFDCPVDQMPRYVSAVVGLPRDWMVRGKCHPTNRPGDPKARTRAWYPDDSSMPIKEQRELLELALAECRLCPVQWDCVTFAIKGDIRPGIWAIDKEDRRSLARHPRWEEISIAGRNAGASVEIVVRKLREDGQIPPRKRNAVSSKP